MTNRRMFSWSLAREGAERANRAGVREERLRATAGLKRTDGAAASLTSWRGRSGRRYVVGVHALAEPGLAELTEAVVIAVRRTGDGMAALLDALAPGPLTSRRSRLRWLSQMRARGATELHVHLLAEGEDERSAVVRDLVPVSS